MDSKLRGAQLQIRSNRIKGRDVIFRDTTRRLILRVDYSIGLSGRKGLAREYLVSSLCDHLSTDDYYPEALVLAYMGK